MSRFCLLRISRNSRSAQFFRVPGAGFWGRESKKVSALKIPRMLRGYLRTTTRQQSAAKKLSFDTKTHKNPNTKNTKSAEAQSPTVRPSRTFLNSSSRVLKNGFGYISNEYDQAQKGSDVFTEGRSERGARGMYAPDR